ncbi:MAG: TonB-dependent receptor [Campylobacteraceae bacterium]|nr:TonB-dependent receptor [Campylobacteraceae bacterium]
MRKLFYLFLTLSCTYLSANESLKEKESLSAKETRSLGDITVEGTKTDDKLSSIPLSVIVIDEKQYLKEGVTSLYDTFANEVGISISGGEGKSQNITIRGLSGNRIKVLKDGVSISDGYGANNLNDVMGSNTFDLTNIKKIEVLKGANAAVQGSGNLGGIILVKTNQLSDYLEKKDQYFSSTSKYAGQSSKYQENIVFAKRLNNLELGFRGNYAKSGSTNNYTGEVYKRDIKSGTFTLMQAYSFEDLYWTNTYEQFEEQANRLEGNAPIQDDGKWMTRSFLEKKNTLNKEFSSNFYFSTNSDLMQEVDVKAYYRNTVNTKNTDIFLERYNNNMIEKKLTKDNRIFQNRAHGLNLNVSNEIEDHEIKYGFTFKNSLHDRPVTKSVSQNGSTKEEEKQPFAKAKTLEFSTYILDKYTINDFVISSSIRYEHSRMTGDDIKAGSNKILNPGVKIDELRVNIISPALSIRYDISDELNIYTSYSFGTKAPSADKVYGYVPHDNSFIPFILKPNLDLEKETSDNIELGLKFKNENTYFHLGLFYSKYNGFIEPITVDASNIPNIKKYVNTSNVKIYGFETTLSHKIKNTTFTTSLGLVDGENDEKEKITNLTPLEGTFKIEQKYKEFDMFTRANFASSMNRVPTCTDQFNNTSKCASTDGWSTVDAGITYTPNDTYTFNIAVFNIFNKQYIKYQDAKGTIDSGKDFHARENRYFNANFKMEF